MEMHRNYNNNLSYEEWNKARNRSSFRWPSLLGSGSKPSNRNQNKQNNNPKKKNMEDLPEGCDYKRSWQVTSFPTCNSFHELDMPQNLPYSPRGWKQKTKQQQQGPSGDNDHGNKYRYMGSGLWRDVYASPLSSFSSSILSSNTSSSSSLEEDPYVLKLFKMEHYTEDDSPYQMHRNIDRHRREANALAWVASSSSSQLSPAVVLRAYAYCGTNLMTEWATQSLNGAIQELQSSSSSTTTDNDAATILATMPQSQQEEERRRQQPPQQQLEQQQYTKLQWALDATRSVAALHSMDIIHADIQTQQFLFNIHGRLALNDLNRCRFVPYHKITTATFTDTGTSAEGFSISNTSNDYDNNATDYHHEIPCPVRIPSAPGPARSPEEYAYHNLTTAMDVYSLGNVLYEIWIGQEPFADIGATKWNRMIMDGTRTSSSLLDGLLKKGTRREDTITDLDRKFGNLLERCWYVDPTRRITAIELANSLQELIQQHPLQHD